MSGSGLHKKPSTSPTCAVGGTKVDYGVKLKELQTRIWMSPEEFLAEFQELWKTVNGSDKRGQSTNNDLDSDISQFTG